MARGNVPAQLPLGGTDKGAGVREAGGSGDCFLQAEPGQESQLRDQAGRPWQMLVSSSVRGTQEHPSCRMFGKIRGNTEKALTCRRTQ